IENNPKILEEIQKYLVEEAPKYIGRGVINKNINELLKNKVSQKVSKSWIKQFYENIFIVSIDKEKMIANFGSPKAKEYALEWIFNNHSIEEFQKNQVFKIGTELKFQNDETIEIEDIKKTLTLSFGEELKLSNLRYIQFLPKNLREELSEWLAKEIKKNKIQIINKINNYAKSVNRNSTFFYEIKYLRDHEIISELLNNTELFNIEHISKYIEIDRELLLSQLQKCGYIRNRYDNLENIKKQIHSFQFVDRNFIIDLVSTNGRRLVFFDELKNDKEVVLSAVESCGSALEFASDELKNDKEVVLSAVENEATSLQYASKELKSDRDIFEKSIHSACGRIIPINQVSSELKRDKELIELMIKKLHYRDDREYDSTISVDYFDCHYGLNHFNYISQNLRGNKEYILNIMRNINYPSFEFFDSLSMELKKDKEILKEFIRKVGHNYKKLDNESKKDKEITMLAFKSFPNSLYFADPSLKGDEEFMIEAFKINKQALKYIKKSLIEDGTIIEKIRRIDIDRRNNKDIVLTAVKKNGLDLQDASKELQNDKEIVLAAVTNSGDALQYASKELQNDKEIVLAAVTNYGWGLHYASEEFKNDKDIVLAAVTKNGYALQDASEKLKNDKEFVLAAVTKNGYALQYASNEFRKDKDIVLAAVTNYGDALHYASEEFKNDKDIVLAAVTNYGDALRLFASEELQNDKEFVLTAVTKNGEALHHASYEFKNDKDIVLAAVTNDGNALQYASKKLQNDKDIVAASKKAKNTIS
ncbi:MAG: DUF4116 domain-containing protein, partial [Fusobacteriaceae bacterium]